MKRLSVAILGISFMLTSSGQDYWEWFPTTPDSSLLRAMAISPEGDIYIGMYGFDMPGGIYRSSDDAQTWQYLGLDDKPVYTLELCNNGDILAGVFCGIHKYTHIDESWCEVYSGVINITHIKAFSSGIVIAGGGGDPHGILRSSDFGESWDTSFLFTNYGEENLNAIAVSPDGDIWTGTTNAYGPGSIYYSNNSGISWSKHVSPCEYLQVYALALHPSGELWAGCLAEGVYRYNFVSGQWTHDFLNVTPDDILFIGNNVIYLGCSNYTLTMSGILYSDDGGQSYTVLNNGMNGGAGDNIKHLIKHPSQHIYAQGVFLHRSTEPLMTSTEDHFQQVTMNACNYPNPFAGYTKIFWNKKEGSGHVELVVTSLEGRLISRESIQNTGSHVFQNNNLQPGVYCYWIASGNLYCTGKMILYK